MDKEFLEGLMEGMPQEVVEAILLEHGKALEEWECKYQNACFDARVREEILAAGGRNVKAICALLELTSDADEGGIREAVENVKKECGYLFSSAQVPPYAAGTGTQQQKENKVESLAQALREKFGG